MIDENVGILFLILCNGILFIEVMKIEVVVIFEIWFEDGGFFKIMMFNLFVVDLVY